MSDPIQEIVKRLPDLESVTEVWDTAERRVEQGDIAFVADLGIAVVRRYGSSVAQNWQCRSVFDHLLRLLTTTPGQEHVEQSVRLVSAAAPDNPKLARYAASFLAESQAPQDLTWVFTEGGARAGAPEELRCCLVQELVLRGVTTADTPEIEAWAASPHWRRHPLAWLPLELSAIEQEPPLPSYSVRGSSYTMPYGPQDRPGVRLRNAAHLPSVTDTTTKTFRAAATTAVANWAEGSNGRSEAGTYDLAEPVDAGRLPDLLATLGLECLNGVDPSNGLMLSTCRPEHAWCMLFAAASSGGAYNNGEYGAYGRLAAWRSLAALSGASTAARFDAVEQSVQACDWYDFDAATEWFERVAWDIGLVSLAPGARRVAVLAATDTD
ncbi:DUF6183 family protein [Streptomyces sp. NPDC001286]